MEKLKLPPDPVSLADGVVQAVREGISEGTLDPAVTYSVYQLAATLGISRSPAREGLLRMGEAGLVEIRKNRGFRVLLPQVHDIEEIVEIRLALEPRAARKASEVGNGEHLESLRETLNAMTTAAEHDDHESFWLADRTLHSTLLKLSGNGRAADIVEQLRATTALLGPATTASGRTLNEILAEHEPIVTAVLAREGVTAEKSMRVHLERTGRLLANNICESKQRPIPSS